MITIVLFFVGIWLIGKFDLSNASSVVLILIILGLIGKFLCWLFDTEISDSDSSARYEEMVRRREQKDKELEDLELMIRNGNVESLTYMEKREYKENVREHLGRGENVGYIIRDWYEEDRD